MSAKHNKGRRKTKQGTFMTTDHVGFIIYSLFDITSEGSGTVDLELLVKTAGVSIGDRDWQIAWRRSPEADTKLIMLTTTVDMPGEYGAAVITIEDYKLKVETSVHKGCAAHT
jgi:hypothetical protein